MADREREAIRQQLEEELRHITFTGHDQVLRQPLPLPLRARLTALWNKELEIPLGALGAAAALLVTGALLFYAPYTGTKEQQQTVQMPRQRELIEAGGNTYWKDIYEQAVKSHEN